MKKTILFVVIVLASLKVYSATKAYKITGQLEKWNVLTIDFNGPEANAYDNEPNPFLDYRLTIEFKAPSGNIYLVPGFYNGNGKGENSGTIWSVRFAPDETGKWTFKAYFRKGKQIAVLDNEPGEPAAFDGQYGKFNIKAADGNAPGFKRKGRLKYVGKHYYKFSDDGYWIKGGTDSPEDFLAYKGFINTPFATHSYSSHVQHWNPGDPDWEDGKGKGIIGALNYLSENNVNSIYFLPMNIGGDGKNVWPFLGVINRKGDPANDNLHYDIKKLHQWETVFSHAQNKGIFLHFVLNEAEEMNKKELDDGTLGVERKLFYREIIARFSHHLALQWNICEEYNLQYKLSPELIKSFAVYINKIDPYKHSITVHHASTVEKSWPPFYSDKLFEATSFQTRNVNGIQIWRKKSSDASNPQVMCLDELFPDKASSENAERHRREYIWPIYFSGGQAEYILDELLKTEDFSNYQNYWKYLWYARKFIEINLPFWEMEPMDELLKGESNFEGAHSQCYGRVFAKKGEVYAIYFPNAKETGKLNLTGIHGDFSQKWYNPRKGEFEGPTRVIKGNGWLDMGIPPSSLEDDWTVLLIKIT